MKACRLALASFAVLAACACQSTPPPARGNVDFAALGSGGALVVDSFAVQSSTAAAQSAATARAVVAQAAANNGYRLYFADAAPPESAGGAPHVSIQIVESEYYIDFERWNSVVAVVSCQANGRQALVAEDTRFSILSAAYLYDRANTVFAALREGE